jgi:L-aminopeptidase/D-esterase-like protein
MPSGSLTDVPGIQVGHFTHDKRPTGCTVVLSQEGVVAGVDVRGGGPGTRETDLLRPEMSVKQVHAVVLSGGSAYGLATADGVMRYLEEKGVGYRAGPAVVPIVPAAILFDLRVGDASIRPDASSGREAAQAATRDPVAQGNVGAGAGATIGKLLGPDRAMKGGLGSASIQLPGGIIVAALAVVNAVGDVVDPDTGALLAGARTTDGKALANSMEQIRKGHGLGDSPEAQNTTIGVVATNVNWTQSQATKVAQMAHDGLGRAIRPVHMPSDGDTVFALGTGGRQCDRQTLGYVGAIAADVMAQAVVSAIIHAEGISGYPAYSDLER